MYVYYLKTALFGSALGDAMEINSNISVVSEWIIRYGLYFISKGGAESHRIRMSGG